ncbi:MAG: DUF2147 domain-containing protein [Alsobacter sp.]
MSPAARRPSWTGVVLPLVTLLGLACGPASAQAADPIAGTWEHRDEDGRVDALIAFSRAGGTIDGRIVKVFPGEGEPADPVCDACTGALHNAPLVGLLIVSGLRPVHGGYEGGRLIDPDTGGEYAMKARVAGDGRQLEVRAYKGVSILGRTEIWTRRP